MFGSPHPPKRALALVPRPLRKCFKPVATEDRAHKDAKFIPNAPNELLNASGDVDLLLLEPQMPATASSSSDSNRNLHSSVLYSSGLMVPTCIDEALVANSCVSVIPGPPSSSVVEIKISNHKMLCIRDNGIVDVFKYGMSDSTKIALAQYAKLHPQGVGSRRGSTTSASAQNITGAPVNPHPSPPFSQPDIISFDALDSAHDTGLDHSDRSSSASTMDTSITGNISNFIKY